MSDRDSFSNLSYHVGGDWRTYCHAYDDRPPIFVISAGRSSVSISVPDRIADKAAVEFARGLALDAQAFAAEMERLYAIRTATDNSTDKADDHDAA